MTFPPAPTFTDDDDADAQSLGARAAHIAQSFAATLVTGSTADEELMEATAQLTAGHMHVELMRNWFRRQGMSPEYFAELEKAVIAQAQETVQAGTAEAQRRLDEEAKAPPSSIPTESAVERARREKLEQQTATLARHLKRHVPPGTGFVLLVANFGERGNTAYAGSIERGAAIALMREWLEHVQ